MKPIDIKQSTEKVGQLYPILVDVDGNIIDGFHRKAADPSWRVEKLEWVKNEIDRLVAALHANWLRRGVNEGEKRRIIKRLVELKKWTAKDMADKLKIPYRTLIDYYPEEKKDKVKQRGKKGKKSKKKKSDATSASESNFQDEKHDTEIEEQNFQPETTTVWKFSRCDPRFGETYRGRCPGQVVQNVLHLYTSEGDLVCDPMAGSGTTIDVCREMGRRVEAFDLNPVRSEVKANNILEGIPLSDNSVNLVFLDPPYGKTEKYEGKADLSSLSNEKFYEAIEYVSKDAFRILKPNGICALLMGTEHRKGVFTDLAFECYVIFSKLFTPEERIIVPYSEAESVTSIWRYRAQKYRFLLRDFRDFLILRKI